MRASSTAYSISAAGRRLRNPSSRLELVTRPAESLSSPSKALLQHSSHCSLPGINKICPWRQRSQKLHDDHQRCCSEASDMLPMQSTHSTPISALQQHSRGCCLRGISTFISRMTAPDDIAQMHQTCMQIALAASAAGCKTFISLLY